MKIIRTRLLASLSVALAIATVAAQRARAAEKPTPAVGGTATSNSSGRVLLEQFNCTACHPASPTQAKWLSPKTAPRLADIGSRVSGAWIERFLAEPHSTMPGTTMPDVLDALPVADRAAAAEALTHFLVGQQARSFRQIRPDRAAVTRGEILFHRVGCVACHAPKKTKEPIVSSVPFPRLSEKWSFEGLRRFLLDPLATRSSGRMPAMRLTDAEAADLAHYLLRETRVPAHVDLAVYQQGVHSLEEMDTAELARTEAVDAFGVSDKLPEWRRPLRFTGWLRIDRKSEYTFYFTAMGASRFSVDGKWLAGEESWETERVEARTSLELEAGWHELKIDYVYRGDQPAAMKLEWEGPGIARDVIPPARLRSDRDETPEPAAFVVDATKAAAGRALYEKLNCAVCHDGKSITGAAKSLAHLNTARGCLAEQPPGNVPDFHLDPTRRESLTAAINSLKQPDLAAPSAQQCVNDSLARFNCTACHRRDGVGGVTAARDAYFTSNVPDTGDEGRLPPLLDGVGDKLVPAWLDAVLVEGASVRPYLDTRMPQFGKENVGQLPTLFVTLDRQTAKPAPVTDDPSLQKEAGRKMVGTDGLSCIACHRFDRQPAQTLQMIDLTTTTQRLNEDWFGRFLRDPNRFHPGTRMPAFWPDGKSPLPKLLGGDVDRQHAALWTYLADGPRAKFPEGLSRQGVEIVVGGEAVVYRGKLWEAGFRAVAVGYPGQLNAAFDAEEMRLSLLWRGRFLNAGPHWQVQGMGQIRPLGTEVVVFPRGAPLAILPDEGAPWPVRDSKSLGMRFRGYQLDTVKRPTLLYSFGTTGLEDFITPVEDAGRNGLRRTITFTDPPPNDLYLRLAVGKVTAHGDNAWRLNDVMTLTIKGGVKPLVRGRGDTMELIVPMRFAPHRNQLEVDYAW